VIAEIGFKFFLFLAEGFDALPLALNVEAGVLGSTSSTAEVVELGIEFFFLLAGLLNVSVSIFEVGFGVFELLTLFLDLLVEMGSLFFEVGQPVFELVELIDLSVKIAFLAFELVDLGLESVGVDRAHDQLT
jgi:hypothetical protein